VRRIDPAWLMRLAQDKDPSVRLEVAQRLSDEQLVALQGDADWRVRYEVAGRIADMKRLTEMTVDADPMVRDLATQRLAEMLAGGTAAPEARIS
jgi:hypothetical protein